MALIVESFEDSDPVPAWLFNVEPKEVSAPPARVVFSGDVSVIETADSFYVVPEHQNEGDEASAGFCLVVNDRTVPGDGFRFVATSKPVRFPLETLTVNVSSGTDQAAMPPPRFTIWKGKRNRR